MATYFYYLPFTYLTPFLFLSCWDDRLDVHVDPMIYSKWVGRSEEDERMTTFADYNPFIITSFGTSVCIFRHPNFLNTDSYFLHQCTHFSKKMIHLFEERWFETRKKEMKEDQKQKKNESEEVDSWWKTKMKKWWMRKWWIEKGQTRRKRRMTLADIQRHLTLPFYGRKETKRKNKMWKVDTLLRLPNWGR